ncbi:aminotransferase class IV [Lysinibacter cavernae]|uniref:4-amino-4-deoxychorismate lyase n=1 Tax=Lysinibacter cavernae TaxID=1640652 RepID=A0A7X5R2D5_9MICO|nr:aminotransferase class IV [Lysinibacter cavernae]NIH54346.1 4-amino-4-deoxychorismate lyase [Lysinibacter cavernae]
MIDSVLMMLHAIERGDSAATFVRENPATAKVGVLDLGVTRGDGIFESVGVYSNVPLQLDAHLERLARSARMLDLPSLDLSVVKQAVLASIAAHEPAKELLSKIVITRGIEGGHGLTGWVLTTTGIDYSTARARGVRVVMLDRGYRSDVAQTAPWLLQGAKTLSYAVNKAALREAARRDADDVVFVSTDGVLLEGPASTVLLRTGDSLFTPAWDFGVLPGTTQRAVFDVAAGLGLDTSYARLTVDDLRNSDAAWLLSSGRLVAPIRAIDGQQHPVDASLTAALIERLTGPPGR